MKTFFKLYRSCRRFFDNGKSKSHDFTVRFNPALEFVDKKQIYYTSPKDLMKRLNLLIEVRAAGNNNIHLRNEISEILDHLLKSEKISEKQYDAFIKRHLQC